MPMKKTLLSLALCAGVTTTAFGAQLIVNGDFETGDLTGWTMNADPDTAFNVIGNGDATVLSGNPTEPLPTGGSFVAVGDQISPGATELRQAFTIVPGLVSLFLDFDWFVNNHDVPGITGALDGSEQSSRVDILFAGAPAFDTGTGVAQNLILNQFVFSDVGQTVPWLHARFDISNLAPGAYELRFGNAAAFGAQEFGVDNVALQSLPEPGSLALALAAMAVLGLTWRRRA